jgi:predicted nucleic acid-binding protein
VSSGIPTRKAVLDASAVVRGLLPLGDSSAEAWLEAAAAKQVDAFVPDLVFAEIAHALSRYVRGGAIDSHDAADALEELGALPLTSVAVRRLARAALAAALDLGLSVYDSCYLVLAEMVDAVLVTADRRLAAASRRAELLPESGASR